MKLKQIRKAEFIRIADTEGDGFIISFQIQLLRTLTKRGLITERQCEKGIALLQGQQQ